MQYDLNQYALGGAFYTTDGQGVAPTPTPTVVVEVFDLAAGTSSQSAGVVISGQVTGLYWCRYQVTVAGSYNIGFRFLTTDASVDARQIISADHNGVADNAISNITITPTYASQIAALAVPGRIVQLRGDDWSFSVGTDLSFVGVTDAWFTIKASVKSADTKSIVQIRESVGLAYINGAVAGTPANGSMAQGTGAYDVALSSAETLSLPPGFYEYDLQLIRSGNIETTELGTFEITADVTRVIS
jgi:hypothetical protein